MARHWLWNAYLALTQEQRITEAEAIGQLQALWPSLPVLPIVKAMGDTSRTLAETMERDSFNDRLRTELAGHVTTVTLPKSVITGKSDDEYDPTADPFRQKIVERSGQRSS